MDCYFRLSFVSLLVFFLMGLLGCRIVDGNNSNRDENGDQGSANKGHSNFVDELGFVIRLQGWSFQLQKLDESLENPWMITILRDSTNRSRSHSSQLQLVPFSEWNFWIREEGKGFSHQSHGEVLRIPCPGGLSLEVTFQTGWERGSFVVFCPLDLDLTSGRDQERLGKIFEGDAFHGVLGWVKVPRGRQFNWSFNESRSIWIHRLVVEDPLPESVWHFRLTRSTYEKIAQSLFQPVFADFLENLLKTHPQAGELGPEIQSRWQRAMIPTPMVVAPTLRIEIFHMVGRLKLLSHPQAGLRGLSGDEIAPSFFQQKIRSVLPRAANGNDSLTDHFTDPDSGITRCIERQPPTPGAPGHPGIYHGIPGSPGGPAVPGPTLAIQVHGGEGILEVVGVAHSSERASGGTGTHGQRGGEGGLGGRWACDPRENRVASGPRGADAPAGSSGAEGEPLACPSLISSSLYERLWVLLSEDQCPSPKRVDSVEFDWLLREMSLPLAIQPLSRGIKSKKEWENWRWSKPE